jgi:hypothetical protein
MEQERSYLICEYQSMDKQDLHQYSLDMSHINIIFLALQFSSDFSDPLPDMYIKFCIITTDLMDITEEI